MSAQWVRCSRCQVTLQITPGAPAKCGACGADLSTKPAGWFVVQDRKKVGPLPLAQLQQLARQGRLAPTDMVLREGEQKWAPARGVAGLFVEATVSPSMGVAVAVPPLPKPAGVPETVDSVGRTGDHVTDPEAKRLGAPLVPQVPGYEILEVLGRGGMGIVYKARQVSLKRLVALKMVLSSHASEAEIARFRAEAEAVAKLQHPNIVQVYEVGDYGGVPYFSLEYVAGGTLAARLRGTPLAATAAARLTQTLALAIDAAHAAGVVHRDLKPGNILLTSPSPPNPLSHGGERGSQSGLLPPLPAVGEGGRGGEGVPKIADFGLAKDLGQDTGQTQTGAIMGTPSYMAPEQAAASKEIGPACDIYALGAILYELLTGRPPFKAATILETLEQVRSQEPVPPSSLMPGLPRDAETICLKCLAKRPADRYASARELAEDLGRYLEGHPILARPAGVAERAVKWARRNSVVAGSAAAIFVVMLAATVWSFYAAGIARAQKQTALEKEAEARKQLRVNHRQSAKMATQAGKLDEALKYYQIALEDGSDDMPGLCLEKARVHASLFQNDEAGKLLKQVLDDPGAKDYHASALLLKSYTTMGSKLNAGLEGVRKALDMGLPPAEACLARSLLAESSPEAVKELYAALKIDKHHHASRTMLGMLLLLLGRIDEVDKVADSSQALYPEDPNFKLMGALVLVLRGQREKADKLVAGIEKQVLPRQYKVIRLTVEMFDGLRQMDVPEEARTGRKVEAIWADIQVDVSTVWPVLEGKVSTTPLEGSSHLLEIPPVVNRSLVDITQTLPGVMLGRGGEDKLEAALNRHPEGTLRLVYGNSLAKLGRWKEARDQYTRALTEPAMGKIRRSCLDGILFCDLKRAASGEKLDEKVLREAMPFAKELAAIGKLRNEEYEMCISVCIHGGAVDEARKVIADWEEAAGRDSVTVWRMRAEAMAANPIGAIEAASRILKREPNHKEAKELREEAARQLKEIAKKLGG